MKFNVGHYIRHVNGVKEFRVYTRDPNRGVYALKEDDSPVIHYYAACHVDAMYRHVGYEKGRPFNESMVAACSAVLDAPKVYAAQPLNPTLPIAPDVAVSLPGLPSGYYLKAFRKASPGDLVLNTSGAVVPVKITQNGMTLYRTIVGRVSDLHKWSDPTSRIPGVPEGWTVIAYRRPKTGEQCFRLGSTEVFTCGENDWAEKRCYVIVQKIPRITPCDGTLPGIPKEYKLVGFGAVKEDQFFIDTVGSLKPGPAKNRLVLEQLPGRPLEVVTEYECRMDHQIFWTQEETTRLSMVFTGRTRKVVVQ